MNKEDYLSGSNFATKSDIVFSEFISFEEYKKKDLDEHEILFKTDEFLLYKLTKFKLSENQSIFCNNMVLKDLFWHLSKVNNLRNIKLITHQTDELITKEIYRSKPQCISEWYSVNVEHKADNLFPLPLGLANIFQKNYLNPLSINGISEFDSKKLDSKLYINFKPSTNSKERNDLYDKLKNYSFVEVDEPNLSVEDYTNKLKSHSFILAPWGNGIDSHRLWESLYLGKIPITKYHHTYTAAKNLPVMFVDDLKEISENDLLNYIKNIDQNFNFELLNINEWFKLINMKTMNSSEEKDFYEPISRVKINKLIFLLKMFLKSKFKIFQFYLNKGKKIPRKIYDKLAK